MLTNHSPLDPSQIERNFSEINPAMSSAEALVEANRCLYCYDAPCMHACPTHIDVPGFIKKIASGNLTGSARVIFDANPIGATCARVCPVEVLCEGACVEKTLLQKPIEIGRLQRYATDHVLTNGKQIFEKGESNGKSVGVVGSGPAGLSCAAYLSRLGYDVTIYDQKEKPGGLDTYGMAEYKMPQAVSLAETERIAAMGVKFMLNTRIVAPGPGEPEVPEQQALIRRQVVTAAPPLVDRVAEPPDEHVVGLQVVVHNVVVVERREALAELDAETDELLEREAVEPR